MKRTSLSAGEIIRALLSKDEEVKKMGVTKIFPIVADTAKLPYISYRRISLEPRALKNGNADTVNIEVLCFTDAYPKSISLAEAVRNVLDGAQSGVDGLRMRSCLLSASEEDWQNDAFIQQLVFTIKI